MNDKELRSPLKEGNTYAKVFDGKPFVHNPGVHNHCPDTGKIKENKNSCYFCPNASLKDSFWQHSSGVC